MYKLQFKPGQFKLNHYYFLFSALPPPRYEAVETAGLSLLQLCFLHQNSPACPGTLHVQLLVLFFKVNSHLSVIAVQKYGGRGKFSTQPQCLSKGTLLMDDPLFDCGSMVGRKAPFTLS